MKENENTTRRMLTVNQAAVHLNIAPRTIYNRIGPKADRPFPVKPKRIGRCVRFDKRDLDRYLDTL